VNRTEDEAAGRLSIELWTFGYKYGAIEANLVVDVRFLPNPYYVPSLCHMTGKDADCASYVLKDEESQAFLDALTGLILRMEASFRAQGKKSLKVAVGCTGGQHRSVAVAEALAAALREKGFILEVIHQELKRARPA